MNIRDNIAPQEIILPPEFHDFVEANSAVDPSVLRLRYSGRVMTGFDIDLAITQIEARRKTQRKLPRFTASPLTLFPTVVSAEQASDELVAAFHARLAAGAGSVADLTAGLGIDAIHNAMHNPGRVVTAVEIDPLKCRFLRHNTTVSGILNLRVAEGDCLEWLRDAPHHDILFIDPARRGENNRRTYAFADCTPDIKSAMPLIMSKCGTLLVKASPLLDISAILKELPGVERIHAVGVRGECKELLIILRKGASFKGTTAVELYEDGSEFILHSSVGEESKSPVAVTSADPGEGLFIHEPTPSMMKTACWNAIASRWPQMRKISPNTHLYVADSHVSGFPGRIWRIASSVGKKELKGMKGECFSIVSRNHPIPASRLREGYRLREGEDDFLIACRWGVREIPVILRTKRTDCR